MRKRLPAIQAVEEALLMWDEEKRCRFDQLRQRQWDGGLSGAEQAELAMLVQELETAEAVYLTPAAGRLRQERETIEAQNRALEVLARRKAVLALRLQNFLDDALAEQQAIESEFVAVLAGSRGSETGE